MTFLRILGSNSYIESVKFDSSHNATEVIKTSNVFKANDFTTMLNFSSNYNKLESLKAWIRQNEQTLLEKVKIL